MPSIAQQDYIVIAPKVGYTIIVDAYALGQLAKILEKKDTSIFDVILQNVLVNDGKDDPNFGRIIGAALSTSSSSCDVWDAGNSEPHHIELPYTSTQYEGLATVQEAGEAQHPGDGMKDSLPQLQELQSLLYDTSTGYFITDLEGHKISVTAPDAKVTSVAISEETDQDGIKVPFEEIQKLVGLPIDVWRPGPGA